ncbi:MAG: hypothetical protein AB7D05_11070 [Mangrovibacterium sp.]
MDKELIYKYLIKIQKSRHFNKSKVSCELLEYLVRNSLENRNPKEYTIGVELFGRKYEDESRQGSNIRVYIHNLRKKLREYYEEEGSRDPVVFVIERGKYRVQFKSRKEYTGSRHPSYLSPFLACLALVFIMVLVLLLKTDRSASRNVWQNLPVWQELADNKRETLLILGDYFVMSGTLPTGNRGVYRDFSVNSVRDFEELIDRHPELGKKLTQSRLTYLSKMAVFCESEIHRVFAATGAPLSVKLLSDVQPADLKSNNLIFVGNYKNMGILENLVRELDFPFGVANSSVQYIFSKDPCARIYEAPYDRNTEEDYALVIYAPGFEGNRFLFFLSAQDIGNISTVSQLADPDYLGTFAREQLEPLKTNDFKALYRVQGINKTDLNFNLIRVEP